ncbi:MAG: riboflavin synthase [Candidatus Latescibacterota bacterium]|nr:riboflavin synthase [Candidatus Latescibacterota bacterium]
MFTGLVEEVGEIWRVELRGKGLQRLWVTAETVTEDLQIGDSINISGTCQTAVEVKGNCFVVESVEETLKRTTLGSLRTGSRVNLERSLRANDRLGGHLVLGHVDGVGKVRRVESSDGQWELEIEPPKPLKKYITGKGSIAVDGASLTVVEVASNGVFTIAIIPHTLAHTNFSQLRSGALVNLEVDVVARYVERLLMGAEETPSGGGLSIERLRELGL